TDMAAPASRATRGDAPAPLVRPMEASRSIALPSTRGPSIAEPAAHAAALAYAPPATVGIPLTAAPTASTPQGDIDSVKQAIGRSGGGRTAEATAVERGISDPLARKLVEWVILRSDNNDADFARYSAFIGANPSWPSNITLRRRAEAMLWQERASSATVRAFFANGRPLSAKGRFALARALLTDGDRAGAQVQAREAWR